MQTGTQIDIKAAMEEATKKSGAGCESDLLIATDEDCALHASLPKTRDARAKQMCEQPENEERLRVLVGSPPYGILLMDEYLETDLWLNSCQAAPAADILRVHEYSYIHNVMESCKNPTPPERIRLLDRDTAISAGSYRAAAKGAGVVIAAIDAVMKKKCHSAFCAVRPPGHHAGPWGAVEYDLYIANIW